MQRMRDKQQKNGQEQGGQAQRAMNRSRQQLDDGEGEQAQQSQTEAEKNLEEMEKELREEENRYESLRSEEVLFRMKERLQDLRKRAAALHEGIVQVDTDRAGGVSVAPDLSLPGRREVFVIGDMASLVDVEGKTVPGLAAAAKQMGAAAAAQIGRDLRGAPRVPFRACISNVWARGPIWC